MSDVFQFPTLLFAILNFQLSASLHTQLEIDPGSYVLHPANWRRGSRDWKTDREVHSRGFNSLRNSRKRSRRGMVVWT